MNALTYLALTLAVVLALTLCERRWACSDVPSAVRVNAVAYLLFTAVQLQLLPLIQPTPAYALIDLGTWPLWLALPVFTLLMDFGEFGFHWAQHKIPWLWRMHALHHSDPNMNVTTTVRHFWGDPLVKGLTVWPLCAYLTSPTPEILAGYALIGIYNFFVHANLRVDFGRWSWLLNSPAYHRRHHSSRSEHFNSNYAGLFPVYDLLFGTYRRPDGFAPTGLEKTPRTFADVALWPVRTSQS